MTTRISITERQLNILQYLERSDGWTSSKTLGEKLGVSNKTIQNELTVLQSIFPSGWEIISSRGVGVRLIRPMDQSILSTFNNRDIQLLYDLLLLIATDKVDTLYNISDALFISTSYAHTLLKQLKTRMAPHQVYLEESPYRLIGEEGFIRALLFKVALAQNGTIGYQRFIDDDRQSLQKVLQNEVGIEQSVFGLNTFYDYIQISLERIRSGHHATPVSEELLARVESTSFAHTITPLFTYLEKHYDIKLSIDEQFYFYYALIHSEFYFKESMEEGFLTTLADPNHHWHEFYLFTRYMSDCTSLPLIEDTLIISGAFTAYFLSKHRSILAITEINQMELFDHIIEMNHLPLTDFTLICQRWAKHYDFLFTLKTTAALLVLLQQFVEKYTKVKALFIKSRSVAMSHFVSTKINRELGGKLELVPILAQDEDTISSYLNSEEFDFILTDMLLPYDDIQCPAILIDTILSPTTCTYIAELTENIKKEKEIISIQPLPVEPYLSS